MGCFRKIGKKDQNRQYQKSKAKKEIRNDFPQRDDRNSILETVWARCKNGE
jgi:hypothetical protein